MFNIKSDLFNGSLSYATLMLFSGSAAGVIAPITADAPGFKDKVELLEAALNSKSTEMIAQAEKYEKDLNLERTKNEKVVSAKNKIIEDQANQLSKVNRSLASLEAKIASPQVTLPSTKSSTSSSSPKDTTPAVFFSSSQSLGTPSSSVNSIRDNSDKFSPSKDFVTGSSVPRNNSPSITSNANATGVTSVSTLGGGASAGSSGSGGSSGSSGGSSDDSGGSSGGSSGGGSSGGGASDSTPPTVTITSTTTSPSATSPFPITVTFSESTTDFIQSDITIVNATISGFTGSGTTYTFNATPTGQGAVTINVAAAVANDAAGNDNTAATQLSITYDSVAPAGVITSTASSPTTTSPIPITVTFNENVTGFSSLDPTIGNGTLSGFSGSGSVYTFDITPTAQGNVTVDIASSLATDLAGNQNSASTQFVIFYDAQIPVLNTIANKNFPSNQVTIGGTALSLDYNDIRLGAGSPTDTGMGYTCYYDKAIDGIVATTNQCDGSGATTPLPGTVTVNSSTGVISWTPKNPAFGAYELKIVGTRGAESDNEIIVVDVQQAYTMTNLRADYDAGFADLTKPIAAGACSQWRDLTTNAFDINSCANSLWSGTGLATSPYRLDFNGTSATAGLGSTLMSGQSQILFNTWLAPNSPAAESVVLSDGGGSGNGFTLKHSKSSGKYEMHVGKSFYKDIVLSDNPVGYWRLNEASGTTASDTSTAVNHGTYTGGVTLAQSGSIDSTDDKSASFDGVNDYVNIPVATTQITNVAMEAWFRTNNFAQDGQMVFYNGSDAGLNGYGFAVNMEGETTGQLRILYGFFAWFSTGIYIKDTQWHHVVLNIMGDGHPEIYLDGKLVYTGGVVSRNIPTSQTNIGRNDYPAARYFNGRIDEVAIYNATLSAARISAHYHAGLPNFYKDRVLAFAPIGYWRLGEFTGTTATDVMGTNNGTYPGEFTLGSAGALTGEGDSNSSVKFNGTSGYISMANSASLNTIKSLSMWVNPTINTAGGFSAKIGPGSWGDSSSYEIRLTGTGKLELIYPTGVASGINGTTTINPGQWSFIALTYDGTTYKIYVNGSLDGSVVRAGNSLGANTSALVFGVTDAISPPYNNFFQGSIDEVSIFNYILTDGQIAALYNGTRYFCRTQSTFANNAWNLISGIFDGSGNVKLLVNGRDECSAAPGTTFTTPATNLTLGSTAATTNYWAGSVADLKIYSQGTSANAKSVFDATADRFRENPVGDIVTTGLVYHLDAANGKNGVSFSGVALNDCSNLNVNWFDLSSLNLTGILTAFNNCSTNAWQGTGVAADPYRLKLDGNAHHVNTNIFISPAQYTNLTIEAWIRPTANASSASGNFDSVLSGDDGGWDRGFGIRVANYEVQVGNTSWQPAGATITIGQWNHIAIIYTPTEITFYKNGTPTNYGSGGVFGASTQALQIGQDSACGSCYFNGDIATTRVYNRALNVSEVSQNCKAQQSRFSGVVCN